MHFIPLQQSWRTACLAFRPRRQRYHARRPKCGRRLDANRITKLQCYKPIPESTIVAIGSVGQHHTTWYILVDQRTDLRQRNIRLGLEADFPGYAGLLASLLVTCPRLGEIELVGRRDAGFFGGKRYAHRHPTVLLLAQLPAVLASDSNRMSSFLREPRVIHDPGRQRMFSRHGWKHLVANLSQNTSIAPGRIGNDVMQRLMHLAHLAGSQTRRHRLYASWISLEQ